jgi:hypothetical protein
MRVSDHLNEQQKKQLNKIKVSLPKPKNKDNRDKNKDKKPIKQDKSKKKEEHINWHEIMGTNRDTYVRGRGGAMRRK